MINDLIPKVERQGQAVWAELETEDQTPLVNIRRSPGRFEVLPPLPVMDEPAVYILHPDVMQINTRKNYVRDRMRAALIYVSEYTETKHMMTEGQYNNDDLLLRLRAVFGRVDQVRHHIDVALQQDDAHRRKRNMRFLVLPTRFPRPESMSQGDTTVWTNWIREETDEIMKQLEEERDSRSDPDDPFNGTANGVFQPLQDPLSLPPPVQMPKRQGNNSEDLEHSENSRKNVRKHNTASREERRNKTVTSIQEQPKRQRSPRKKKSSEWTLNQRQFDHSKTQEISHILPGEQLNVFNGEESVSYLQLPVKKKEENRFCTRCGIMGHGRRYCQVNTWCKFCITDTHATQACRRYEKFVKDNPIASSRRNTPIQVQGQRVTVNPRDQPQQPLFPHPPVQRYNPTVIPQMQMHILTPQREKRESREHSRNSQIMQQTAEAGGMQRREHAAVQSDLREDSQNLLKMTSVSRNTEDPQKKSNPNRGIHSEFIEQSQQSLGALNVGKSQVQATDQLTTQHIPLTGYENFRQDLQTYPVSRDPMTVQPTGAGNVSNSQYWIYRTLTQTCPHLCYQTQVLIIISSSITKYIRRK